MSLVAHAGFPAGYLFPHAATMGSLCPTETSGEIGDTTEIYIINYEQSCKSSSGHFYAINIAIMGIAHKMDINDLWRVFFIELVGIFTNHNGSIKGLDLRNHQEVYYG